MADEGFNITVGGIAIGPWHPDFDSARRASDALTAAGVSGHKIERCPVEVTPDHSSAPEPQEWSPEHIIPDSAA